MRQTLEIMKPVQQSNCAVLPDRTSMKPSEGPGLALYDKNFIQKTSNGNAHMAASGPAASFPSRRPVIKIFVVYDDDLSRDRARHMEEDLGRRLGCSFNISISSWKLKSLWHPKMLQTATDAAAKAEIILFSLLSGRDLPQAAKNWLENGLITNPAHKTCLLALLETGGVLMPRLSPAEVYLSNLSSKVGVDCLCYSDSIPLARFSRYNRQHGGGNRGNGFTPRRPKTISAR